MPTPVSYLSGASLSNTVGMFKRGTMAQNLKSSLESGYRWWNGIEVTSSQYLIYSDTFTMGTSTQANSIPVAWSTPDLTDQNLLNLINTLPPRVGQTAFTSLPIALQWLQSSNKFFLIRGGTENIVKSGLKLYVDAGRFDSYIGNGTTWSDLSGNNNNGTLVNGTGYNSSGVGSMVFDGSDDYVNCGNGITTTTQITVSAWVKLNVNNIFQHIVDSANNTWHLAVLSDGRLYFWDGGVYHTNGPILSTGKWYHVVGVKTATTNDIYVNGILGSSLDSNVSIPTNNVWIGRWQPPGDGRIFNGNISNVQIYDTALSPQQILQNYNTQKLRFGYYDSVQDGLIFDLDAGNYLSYPRNGTTWTDLTGKGNNGTLINGPTFSSGTTPSIVFDGSDDYVNCINNTNITGSNPSTMEITCEFTSLPLTFVNAMMQIGEGSGHGNFRLLYLRYVPGEAPQPRLSVAWYDSGFSTNFTPIQNQIYTFTYTDNGSNESKLYINGSLLTTYTSYTALETNTNALYIGKFSYGGVLSGKVYDSKIYNRVLTPQEVIQNFESQRVNFGITGITTNGLVLNLDAANNASYGGSGTTWVDTSGSGFDGTLINGPTYSNSGASSGIVLDGSDDYIKSNISKSSFPNLITLSICFKLLSFGDIKGLLQFANGLNDTIPWILIRTNGSNTMSWYLNGNYQINQTILTNTVYFLDLTYDGTTWRAYKNGILDGSWTGPFGVLNGDYFWIGNGYNGYTNIQVYNTKLYNRNLTSNEILQNYNATKGRFGL